MSEPVYYSQLQAKRYADLMLNAHDDFDVCKAYLQDLDKSEFIDAYKLLHSMYREIYLDMMKRPAEYALPLYDISVSIDAGQGSRVRQAPLGMANLLYCLFSSGIVKDGCLSFDRHTYAQLTAKAHIPNKSVLINILRERGFEFAGWNGKSFDSKMQICTVRYPDAPNIMTVLKAMSDKGSKLYPPRAFSITSNIIVAQVCFLHYRLFADPSENILPYDIDDYREYVGDMQAEFIIKYCDHMQRRGMRVQPGGFYRISFLPGKETNAFNFLGFADFREGIEHCGMLILKIRAAHIARYADKLNDFPDVIKHELRTNGRCRFCVPKCGARTSYELDGEKIDSCTYRSYEYGNLDVANIDYYTQLFDMEREYCRK